MKSYDLLDKELKIYYISATKYCCIASFITAIALLIASIFFVAIVPLSILFWLISLVFCCVFFKHRKKYGRKLTFNNNVLSILDCKNRLINEINFNLLKYRYLNVGVDYARSKIFKQCIVLYSNFELFDNMDFSSYWNEPNIVKIQNPTTIEKIEEQLLKNKIAG